MTTTTPFSIVRSDAGGRCSLVVSGDLDIRTTSQLQDAVKHICDAPVEIVLDLRDVPFMDSSGLRGLLVAHDQCAGRLSIVCSEGGAMRRIFQVTQLEKHLRLIAADKA